MENKTYRFIVETEYTVNQMTLFNKDGVPEIDVHVFRGADVKLLDNEYGCVMCKGTFRSHLNNFCSNCGAPLKGKDDPLCFACNRKQCTRSICIKQSQRTFNENDRAVFSNT